MVALVEEGCGDGVDGRVDEEDGERVDVDVGAGLEVFGCAAWAERDGVRLDEERGEDEDEDVDGEVENV